MDWVKLACSYYSDPAVASLPTDSAEVMFTRGIAYSGLAETAGFIPTVLLPTLARRGTGRSAGQLVEHGLWQATPTGFFIPKWEKHQADLEALRRIRANARERRRRFRERHSEDDGQ